MILSCKKLAYLSKPNKDQIMEIDQHKIDDNSPVFIIAEIGVNHNGNYDLACEMVEKAAACGADCVKFQTFKAERVVTASAPKAKYQLNSTPADESQEEMLRKLEFPEDRYADLMALCRSLGVVFMSTPYNFEDVDLLNECGVSSYKLASIHAAEPEFCRYVAGKGKPVVLSTGMATLSEVAACVDAIRSTGNSNLAILQCTTNYPSLDAEANLGVIETLKNEFRVVTGYSDHTHSETSAVMSVALGARILERHFTIDKSLPGPDQSTSSDPDEFSEYVKKIRQAEILMGSSEKKPAPVESKNIQGMRRSLVAAKNINAGDIIEREMLIFKRPASGIPVSEFERIVGKVATRNIEINSMIEWADISEQGTC